MNAADTLASIDDIRVSQGPVDAHEEIPNVVEIIRAMHTNDEQGIIAKMLGAPNAPDPSRTQTGAVAIDFSAEVSTPGKRVYAWQRIAAKKGKA